MKPQGTPKVDQPLADDQLSDEQLQSLDEILQSVILKQGRQLIGQLYVLVKTARIHQSNNAALQQVLAQYLDVLRELINVAGTVSLEFTDDDIYCNGYRLRADVVGYMSQQWLIHQLQECGIGRILFDGKLDMDGLVALAAAFREPPGRSGDAFAAFSARLPETGVAGVTLEPVTARADSGILDQMGEDRREQARFMFFGAIQTIKSTLDALDQDKPMEVRVAKRVVHSIVDLILEDEISMFGVVNIKNHDEYTLNHSVNTCILSVLLGQRIGLDRSQLGTLGMAALFHDVGKIFIPREILNKPSALTPAERKVMDDHPVRGVRALLRMRGMNDLINQLILSSFEHHIGLDGAGYPRVPAGYRVHLFSRIVSIADTYDAMTTIRPYRPYPILPADTLRVMTGSHAGRFDPALLNVFVNMLGVFPVGSLVELDNGELAVVCRANSNPAESGKPRVKIVRAADGRNVDGPVWNLAKPPAVPGAPSAIVRAKDPLREGINVLTHVA